MAESDIVRFQTESGSHYEIDQCRQLIRRLFGTHPPTPRQGDDRRWQLYSTVSVVEVGQPVMIVWRVDVVDGHEVGRSTITSRVVAVEPIAEGAPRQAIEVEQ